MKIVERDGFGNDELKPLLIEREDIPDATKKANESLRRAANRLSLAFRIDSQLLFLGDLESKEINTVVNNLEAEQRLRFPIMLTPHHGTHWGKEMQKLAVDVAASSVGKKLFKKVKPDYKCIADHHLITYTEGEVVLPTCLGPKYKYVPWWYFL